MQIARIAQSMVGVAIVLFTITVYRSAELAGLVTFLSIAPGLLVSPLAGALLDRHGRSLLIRIDFVVAFVSLTLIGALSILGLLPVWLLLLIATVSSLTQPLSATGLRSLFPILVPSHLWERVNAVDSMGYVVATIAGPPLAGALVGIAGGPLALIVTGLVYAVAAAVLTGIPDPRTDTSTTGRLFRDAWDGVVYTWRNPTLRALGFSISALNLSGGVTTIAVPLILIDRLHEPAVTVGLTFAAMGIGGGVAALAFGRIDSSGRERRMLVVPMLASGAALLLLLPMNGLALVIVVMTLIGLLNGPMDIALFTVRQRRTDPAWMGRAFAVSMAFNFAGFPVGSAISGWLAPRSMELVILFGAVACLAAAILALGIPTSDERMPEGRAGVETAESRTSTA